MRGRPPTVVLNLKNNEDKRMLPLTLLAVLALGLMNRTNTPTSRLHPQPPYNLEGWVRGVYGRPWKTEYG